MKVSKIVFIVIGCITLALGSIGIVLSVSSTPHMRVMMSVLSRRRGHICLPIVFTRIIKGMGMANSFCRTLLILYTKRDTQNSPSVWRTIMQEQSISMTASDLQSFSPESMRNIKVMDMSMDCI